MRISLGGWIMAATPVDEHNKFHCNVSYYQCRQYVKYNSARVGDSVAYRQTAGVAATWCRKIKISKWEMSVAEAAMHWQRHKNSFWKLLHPTPAPASEAQINNDANGVDGATRLHGYGSRCIRVGSRMHLGMSAGWVSWKNSTPELAVSCTEVIHLRKIFTVCLLYSMGTTTFINNLIL